MEFSNLREDEQTTNSSTEEVDQEEPERVSDGGIGRSYECMFCKRGFTTAQALGGHMNIHRKDRASKSKPSTSRKQDQGQYYSGPRFYQPIFTTCPPQYFAAQDAQIHYRTYLPSTSSARPVDHHHHHHHHHHSNNYSGAPNPHRVISASSSSREEMRMSLSLQSSRSLEEEEDYDHIDSIKRIRDGSEEGELDLELRLGHYP